MRFIGPKKLTDNYGDRTAKTPNFVNIPCFGQKVVQIFKEKQKKSLKILYFLKVRSQVCRYYLNEYNDLQES